MEFSRLYHSIQLLLLMNPERRAKYIKKHNIFKECGDNCMFMFRKIPIYPQYIKCHNNVRIASNVTMCTHDAIHRMFNNIKSEKVEFKERIGCIELLDNVFIGTNSVVLYDTKIGPNVIVAANSLVNKDIANGVYGGVPAKYICSINEYKEKIRNRQKRINENVGDTEEEKNWNFFKKEHYL